MSTEFTREDRYIVFKLSDVERYLTDADRAHLEMMKNEIDAGRDCANKPPFKGLIVESDWPEYEPTWKAIEARVTGAQPAPIEQDTSVRKAWARFSNELHRSPDAPYPGMSGAFEKHFSQRFTDREWRAESGVWAAAWKAAKNHGAQPAPSIPDGWLRAIDEALVVAHIGVANESDTYEQAKAKLDNLIGFHVDVATDPAVNGGWNLVPIETTWRAIEARVTGAQPAQKAVAYLDLGVGGYMDIGTDLTDEQLASLPKGRHMLGIVGTYGVDGYVSAQPAPSVPEDVMRDAERYRYLRARDDDAAGVGCWIEAEGRACDRGWLYGDQLDSAIDTCIEMLAAAPEAKP